MPRAFIIGHPVSHSRSPMIHNHWLKTMGLAGSYEAIDTAPEGVGQIVARMRAGELVGGNVTIPLKETVLGHLDYLDPLAKRIGAVNTLVRDGARIAGFNTDYVGFLANLDQKAPGWDKGLSRAVVLGAGGAARAVLVALAHRKVPEIVLLNRTPDKAMALAAELGAPLRGGALSDFADVAPGAGLVVNTSSVGMHGTRFDNLPLGRLPRGALVTDIVYVPLITPLLADAKALGYNTVDGLGMLLHQAVPGFKAWFGAEPAVTADLHAMIAETLK